MSLGRGVSHAARCYGDKRSTSSVIRSQGRQPRGYATLSITRMHTLTFRYQKPSCDILYWLNVSVKRPLKHIFFTDLEEFTD